MGFLDVLTNVMAGVTDAVETAAADVTWSAWDPYDQAAAKAEGAASLEWAVAEPVVDQAAAKAEGAASLEWAVAEPVVDQAAAKAAHGFLPGEWEQQDLPETDWSSVELIGDGVAGPDVPESVDDVDWNLPAWFEDYTTDPEPLDDAWGWSDYGAGTLSADAGVFDPNQVIEVLYAPDWSGDVDRVRGEDGVGGLGIAEAGVAASAGVDFGPLPTVDGHIEMSDDGTVRIGGEVQATIPTPFGDIEIDLGPEVVVGERLEVDWSRGIVYHGPDLTEVSDLTDVTDLTEVTEVTDLTEVTEVSEVSDVTEVSEVADDPSDAGETPDPEPRYWFGEDDEVADDDAMTVLASAEAAVTTDLAATAAAGSVSSGAEPPSTLTPMEVPEVEVVPAPPLDAWEPVEPPSTLTPMEVPEVEVVPAPPLDAWEPVEPWVEPLEPSTPEFDTRQISELASAGALSESLDDQGPSGSDEPFVAIQVTQAVESGDFGDFVSDIVSAEINEAAADGLWDDLG
ncbi:MAG: hypothetical protein R2743_14375 [Ilumatobacteraceae bacterium]